MPSTASRNARNDASFAGANLDAPQKMTPLAPALVNATAC